jgi:hypothetical protein
LKIARSSLALDHDSAARLVLPFPPDRNTCSVHREPHWVPCPRIPH